MEIMEGRNRLGRGGDYQTGENTEVTGSRKGQDRERFNNILTEISIIKVKGPNHSKTKVLIALLLY